jgi:hypothetical protein
MRGEGEFMRRRICYGWKVGKVVWHEMYIQAMPSRPTYRSRVKQKGNGEG